LEAVNPPAALTRLNGRVALRAFVVTLFVYLVSGAVLPDSHDTTPNAYVPVSLLTHGDLAFSPLEAPVMFLWSIEGPKGAVPVTVQGWDHLAPGSDLTFAAYYQQGALHFLVPRYFLVQTKRARNATGEPLFVGAFGSAAGLTALPAAIIAYLLGADLQRDAFAMFRVAKVTAALLTAASVALVFLTALAFITRRRALLLAVIYAFGTCVWSISSQGLWQQTPELFFLSLGVLCVIRGDSAWIRGAVAGLAFSAAAACRPTAAIVGLAAAGYLAMSDRRSLAAYALAALPLGLGVLAYNAYYFSSALDFGQLAAGAAVAKEKTGSAELWQTPAWVGAAGLLFSPSRGLLVYTPFFAAALAGAVLAWKDEKYASLRFLTIAVPALWLPAFVWFDWWGGWTYGYRPIVDSAPLLAILCVPAIDRILARPAWSCAFAAAAGWSVFVQLLGVLVYTPPGWNARAVSAGGAAADIDLPEYRARLWSFRDWQIGYLIANFSALRAAR
jgi:hypothetical protein